MAGASDVATTSRSGTSSAAASSSVSLMNCAAFWKAPIGFCVMAMQVIMKPIKTVTVVMARVLIKRGEVRRWEEGSRPSRQS